MKKITSSTQTFVKRTAHKTWGTALWVALLFGGIALAVSSFQGPPAGCTPTNCPANPLKVVFSNTDPKVQIGTSSLPAKLEVASSIKMGTDTSTCTATNAGSIRFSSGKFEGCDGASWEILGGNGSGGGGGIADLVNAQHSSQNCIGLGGGVMTTSNGNKFCKFTASSCPTGWARYEQWSATQINTCTATGLTGCYSPDADTNACNTLQGELQTICTTGSHTTFSNTPPESCSGEIRDGCTYMFVCQQAKVSKNCNATTTAIGCY